MLAVKLDAFEGPLDLLLSLIDRNKVSIYDIPIAVITDQYLAEVAKMPKMDLDLSSSFLVMAATLLDIKAKMLLPAEKDEDGVEIDPREELVKRLAEYKLYRSLAEDLKADYQEAEKTVYRAPSLPEEVRRYIPPMDTEDLLSDVTLTSLLKVFHDVCRRQIDRMDPIRSQFGRIEKDPVRLSDRLIRVFDYAEKKKVFSFRELLEKGVTKQEVIVMFLACLEMIHIGRLTVEQDHAFAEIWLRWNENCETTITVEEMEEYD